MSFQRQRPLIIAAFLGIAIGYYTFDEPLRQMAAQLPAKKQKEATAEPEWRIAAAAKRAAAQQQQQQQQQQEQQQQPDQQQESK
ncbi:hypothetical protein OEZ85_013316 [Tetradesmus obliquus]|uniref:Uncharacterized protein n=1 Tax=Tetradesmus obliquus TaxID=3088 RepID=A0ABY8UAG1_TETOB|nr:hypothetical protein OEZ85_013316 [Tetradesmus obliquus]